MGHLICCGRRPHSNTTVQSTGHEAGDVSEDGVERFRRFWDDKLKDVADMLSLGRAPDDDEMSRNPFHVTLQLYAHKDVVDQLYLCYDEHPDEVEFYIPQLCTFLLHGQYDKNPALEFFLLSQCRRSLQFAHRLHWFLESFCGTTYRSEGLSATVHAHHAAEGGHLLQEIARQGGVPAKLFSMGLTESECAASKELMATRLMALQVAEAHMDSPEHLELVHEDAGGEDQSPSEWSIGSPLSDNQSFLQTDAAPAAAPVIAFRERWADKQDRLRRLSPYGTLPGWRVVPVIVKSHDDLRQEQFAAQIIAQCHHIFVDAQLPLSLRPYAVLATSATSGLIEAVPDTVSLDSLKKNDPDYKSLLDFYERYFGSPTGSRFKRARVNFIQSLSAYSILCFVFQIKDRHNGNILLDALGHIIHIDFGFLFTNSPGGNIGFESAPFKLTDEFVELMAYWALHKNMDKLLLLVEMMLVNDQAELRLPCFSRGKKATMDGLRQRLNPGLGKVACQEGRSGRS
ncbi:hypothetical protein DYB37_007622 [Aphanomyces astaci]|uniref:PI3K/PI4K catalytic domain-containing protein n=1 Tax=Aphanomyces astaci TaxID=112090 RepID=A0A418E1V1_APHAT|nr:hypothetical protein DYB37_007622 [Aphanomyces astaci]